MDVSPQLLREVEFREQWRGYNPDEVDDFLERLAVALEELQARLRETSERAARAERRVLDASSDDDELRRTLVLARRTADATIEEARAEAAGIVAEAERVAASLRAEAEARAEAELAAVADRRRQLETEAEALSRFVEEHRRRLHDELREQLAWIEQEGRLSLPPPPDVTALERSGEPASSEAWREEHAAVPHPVVTDDEPVVEAGEPTGFYDVLAEDHEDADEGDDPFMAELRRAVTDTEPLGPREHRPDRSADDHVGDEPPSDRFGRRRR